MNIEEIKKDPRFQSACTDLGLDYNNSSACKNVIFVYHKTYGTCFLMNAAYEVIGTDVAIKSNTRFRESQISYDVDFYLFDKVILLETPQVGLYFLLDRNFNCFDMIFTSSGDERELEYIANMHYLAYTTRLEDLFAKTFGPLQGFSAEILLSIACRIENVRTTSQWSMEEKSEKLSFTINKMDYSIPATDKRGMMLCFIKYLGETAKLYFKSTYPLMSTKVISSIPSIAEYLNKIASDMFVELSENTENSPMICAQNIICKYGQADCYERLRYLAEITCKLLRDIEFDMDELTRLANCCLNILSFPDEEFRRAHLGYERKDETDFDLLFQSIEEKTIRLWK